MPPHKSYTLCDKILLSESEAKKLIDKSLKWEERKPIGVRFNPSDRALAKICVDKFFRPDDNIVLSFFRKINVYEYDPRSLSNFAHEFGEGKLYFFTPRRKKYGKGKNIDRTVSRFGFWRKTGSDEPIEILDNSNDKLSVTKISLTFYKTDEKTPKGAKTPWLMKEYMLEMESCENSVKSDDLDPLVLCVIYSNDSVKQNQSHESETRSELFDEGSEIQSLMPPRVVGSSQVSDNIIIPSSLVLPTTAIQNSSHCPQDLMPMPFADPVNPENFHFSLGNFPDHQIYHSSNPGLNILQQGLPMVISSEQNMETESQDANYWSYFNPEPVSASGFQLIQDSSQSPDSFISYLHQQPDFMDYHNIAPCLSSFNPEPVSESCFQLIEDSGQSLDIFMSNFPNPQLEFMDCQPRPDPCENSNSIVHSPSDTINNNNLLDENGNLNHNRDPIMDLNGPLFSPFPNEYFVCPDW